MKTALAQACKGRKTDQVFKVESDSRAGLVFAVSYTTEPGKPAKWECDCEHFRYRGSMTGSCKHIERQKASVCRWASWIGPEAQSPVLERNHVCPKCGGKTFETAKEVSSEKKEAKKAEEPSMSERGVKGGVKVGKFTWTREKERKMK